MPERVASSPRVSPTKALPSKLSYVDAYPSYAVAMAEVVSAEVGWVVVAAARPITVMIPFRREIRCIECRVSGVAVCVAS